jgi:hypothetical protein
MRTFIAAVLAFVVCAPLAFARTWTDSAGTHTVEAEFVDFKDGKVQLKKENGETVTIPIEKLGDEDQEFVKSQAATRSVRNPPAMPLTIEVVTTQTDRGQELAVKLSKPVDLEKLLHGDEKFNLTICYLPNAKSGQVKKLVEKTIFHQEFATWSRVNGGPNYPEYKPMYMGGNFHNPNGNADLPGAVYVILGHFKYEQLSVETLQKTGKIVIPFQSWIMGSDKLVGSGRVAVCITKSKDHYLKGQVLLSNIDETDASFPEVKK